MLLGTDTTAATSGTSAKSWGLFNNDGTFYINKNNSSAANSARAMATSTGWTFGNTSTNSYALNAETFICDSWIRTKNATGWYNETYYGGWYMTDTNWIRNFNNKPLLMTVSTYPSIACNATTGTESNIRFELNGSNKGYVGYSTSYGQWIYNSTAGVYLGIKDDGTPHVSGNTIWHAGNDGTGSGLDADTVDGCHATYFHRNHRTDITDLTKAINSDTVTFDKSNFTGAPDSSTAYFNGFVSVHSNYLSSFIVNKHRSNDWWVGYIDTKQSTAVTWKKLAFTSDIPTNLNQLTNGPGYITSRGYLGTTAIQASSATQNVTGVGTLSMSDLLTISKNSNTVTIGSINGAWCHFQNSADIPFYFNKAIHSPGGFTIYNTSYNFNSSGNINCNTLTATELHGKIGIKGYSSSANLPLVFADSVNSSTSSSVAKQLYTDTSNTIYYNPSTNVLNIDTVEIGFSSTPDISAYFKMGTTSTISGTYNCGYNSSGTWYINNTGACSWVQSIPNKYSKCRYYIEVTMTCTSRPTTCNVSSVTFNFGLASAKANTSASQTLYLTTSKAVSTTVNSSTTVTFSAYDASGSYSYFGISPSASSTNSINGSIKYSVSVTMYPEQYPLGKVHMIGNNGTILVDPTSGYVTFNVGDMFYVKRGKNRFRISATNGIQKNTTYASSWTNI